MGNAYGSISVVLVIAVVVIGLTMLPVFIWAFKRGRQNRREKSFMKQADEILSGDDNADPTQGKS